MKLKKMAAVLLTAVMLSSFAAGCGSSIDTNAVAATLDSKEISMGVANFMAQYQAVQMDAYFLSYYGENMWSTDSGDGTTMTDSVKEDLMESLQEYYLLDAHTSDYDVELTDEEKAEITEAASKFIADNTDDALSAMGATQETVEEMLRLYKIQSKMHEAIIEQIDTKVSDEECAQKTFSYVKFEKPQETDSDTDTENTEADDATADDESAVDPKKEAEEFLADAQKDMDAAVNKGSYTVMTCSFGSGDLKEDDNTTSLDVAVLKAADQLKDKKVADSVIEADDAFYVIRMDDTDDEDAAETKKESILSKRRTDKYDEVLKGYKDACKWEINESEWKKVNFDELYTIKAAETTTDDNTTADSATGTDGSTAADDGTDDSTAADGTDGSTAADDGTDDSTAADGTDGSTAADDGTDDSTAADGTDGSTAADGETDGGTADENSTDNENSSTAADDGAADGTSADD